MSFKQILRNMIAVFLLILVLYVVFNVAHPAPSIFFKLP